MIIDGNFLDEKDLVANESKFLKKINNIYISEEQVSILKKYDIIVDNYVNVSELIYEIETYLNESDGELDDLEWVSQTLSEYNYYNNTNK